MLNLKREPWHDKAACIGAPDVAVFFPERGAGRKAIQFLAVQFCLGENFDCDCPVITECLAYSLNHNEQMGIWGGVADRDRRQIKRGHLTHEEALEKMRKRYQFYGRSNGIPISSDNSTCTSSQSESQTPQEKAS